MDRGCGLDVAANDAAADDDIPGAATVGSMAIDPAQFDPPPESEEFFADCLRLLSGSGIPFLVSGTYALACYTSIVRPTKDVDIFATASDTLRILNFFRDRGYRVENCDERWIAKVWRGKHFMDVIFNMPSVSINVTDDWFEQAPEATIYDAKVRVVPPTEFIWSKIFVKDRYRYDGADIAHVILKKHEAIDWKRLLSRMELHWEVLLASLIDFRFVYPSERDLIPDWLMDELIGRLAAQRRVAPPTQKICRGRLYSPRDYQAAIRDWGFKEAFGGLSESHERD